MALKKGVSAKDLRPFSISDPQGLGLISPTQERIRERFHRRSKGRFTSSKRPPTPADTEQSIASAATFQPTANKTSQPWTAQPWITPGSAQPKTKPQGGGCFTVIFTVLIILGALYAAGQMFVPLIWSALMHKYLMQTGQSAQGQILSAQPTSSTWNKNTVYTISLEVHAPGLSPYQTNIKQALSSEQAARLTPGVWAELRYDTTDLDSVVIESIGIPDPRDASQHEDVSQQDRVLNLQRVDPAQIMEDLRKRMDALSNLPDQGQPGGHADSPQKGGAPAQEPTTRSQEDATNKPLSTSPDRARTSPSPAAPSTASITAPSPQPVESIALACLQATACCKIAEGKACASFSLPGIDEKSCKRALRSFARAAETAGKNCSGLRQ